MPGLRPGMPIRITAVTLIDSNDEHPMEGTILRAVKRQFPEFSGRYHLPRFGRVVAVPDAPEGAGLCDDFRPRFAVDVEVLLPNGEPDPELPTLQSLPLPVPNGEAQRGLPAARGRRSGKRTAGSRTSR